MESKLDFLPEALSDAELATSFYEKKVEGLGSRFRREFEGVCAAIGQQPLLWRERKGGFRRVNFKGFPYYIAYILRGDGQILVIAVGHGSRHPDYWKNRFFRRKPFDGPVDPSSSEDHDSELYGP